MVGGIEHLTNYHAMLNPILASKCGINQEWLESVIITTPTIVEDAMLDKILVSRCRIKENG